jgi:hypothetical protein
MLQLVPIWTQQFHPHRKPSSLNMYIEVFDSKMSLKLLSHIIDSRLVSEL